MAISGFPDQIQVTLSNRFVGGGNGLVAGPMVLTKVSGEDSWTESGAAQANQSNNRIRIAPESGGVAPSVWNNNVKLVPTYPMTYTTFWPYPLINFQALATNNTYPFKGIWQAGSGGTPTPSVSGGVSFWCATVWQLTGNPSFSPPTYSPWSTPQSVCGSNGATLIGKTFNQVFTTMEEYVEPPPPPIGPDKTPHYFD